MDPSVCENPKCYTDDKGEILCPVKCVAVCQSHFFSKAVKKEFIILFYESSLRNLEQTDLCQN